MHACIHTYMVRRLAFLAPPPPRWYGLAGVGGGGGAGVCEEWSGRFGGVLLWAAMGHREGRDLAQALRKP